MKAPSLSLSRNPLVHIGEYQDEKGRDYFFDNARFILIMLVVIGHFIQPLQSSILPAKYLWRLIYVLHMPCMIFISGYFSKKYVHNRSGRLDVQKPFTYAVLYIAAWISMFVFHYIITRDIPDSTSIFLPQTGMWYLQVLFIWHLFLPVIDRIKPLYVMIIAILAGLLVGYDPGADSVLSTCRTLNYLPYFLVGYYIDKDTVQKLFTRKAKIYAAIALVAVLVIFYFLLPYGIGDFIVGRKNYWDLSPLKDFSPLVWWGVRLFCYIMSALLCFAFLAFVPRSWNILTRFGSRTLQVYILHMFIFEAINELELWKPFDSIGGFFAAIGLAIATTLILSLKIFSYPFIGLQSIKIKRFLKSDD